MFKELHACNAVLRELNNILVITYMIKLIGNISWTQFLRSDYLLLNVKAFTCCFLVKSSVFSS